MHRVLQLCGAGLLIVGLNTPALAQEERGDAEAGQLPSIDERTASFEKLDGFYTLYWDEPTGPLYLGIPRLGDEVLYQSGLAAGLGSNDIGLDRAQLGSTATVRFERVGTKILMVQPPYSSRSPRASWPCRRRSSPRFRRGRPASAATARRSRAWRSTRSTRRCQGWTRYWIGCS